MKTLCVHTGWQPLLCSDYTQHYTANQNTTKIEKHAETSAPKLHEKITYYLYRSYSYDISRMHLNLGGRQF